MTNKRLLTLVVILTAMAAIFFSHGSWRGPGTVELPDEATGRVGIQYLMAELCTACRDMEPVLDEVKEVYGDRVFIQVIDIYARPGTIRAYGISVVPALAIFDPEGKMHFKNEGVMSFTELTEVLDKISGPG
jgi:thiol-disulfide isomerase/thioredoxin